MNKLKEIRLANKLSQSQLAKKSEVSIRAIQKYEQKEVDINVAAAITVYKLAKALNVKMEDLIDTEQIKFLKKFKKVLTLYPCKCIIKSQIRNK